jgi:hypothetical protein
MAEQQLSSIKTKLEEQTNKIATLDTKVNDIAENAQKKSGTRHWE